MVAIEEISKACATTGLILAVQELGALAVKLAGTDEQKQRWLPRLASGEWLAAYALTEPGSGSDSAAMRTTAQARRRRVRPRRRQALHHERRRRRALHGLRQDRPRSRPQGNLVLHGRGRRARASRSAGSSRSSGSRARRRARCSSTAAASRRTTSSAPRAKASRSRCACSTAHGPGIAAQALGIAQGATDYALDYAKTRETMGKPISSHQLIAAKLADMDTACEAARGLLHRFARMADEASTGPS